METKKKSITFRLSDDGHAYLARIGKDLGISKTAVVELALRRMQRETAQNADIQPFLAVCKKPGK